MAQVGRKAVGKDGIFSGKVTKDENEEWRVRRDAGIGRLEREPYT